MINFNGEIPAGPTTDYAGHISLLQGDTVLETLRIHKGTVVFLEAHYFRLMASMRIMRMVIPMTFTMEYFSEEITRTVAGAEKEATDYYVTLGVYNKAQLDLQGTAGDVEYLIVIHPADAGFGNGNPIQELTVFKDHRLPKGMLSAITERSGVIGRLAGIFARENNCEAALVLNTDGHIAGTSGGNIFMVKDEVIYTPGTGEGVSNTVYRREAVKRLKPWTGLEVVEKPLTAYDISTAREVFVLDVQHGVRNVLKFRKTVFQTTLTDRIREQFSELISDAN